MTDITEKDEQAIDALEKRYHVRIMNYLRTVADLLNNADFPCNEPYTMHDEIYRWSMSCWRTEADKNLGHETCIDISVEIAESRTYDGEMADGVNFGVDIVEYGGRILGGLAPYNYTDQCWVSAADEDAVEERWKIIATADMQGFVNLLRNP